MKKMVFSLVFLGFCLVVFAQTTAKYVRYKNGLIEVLDENKQVIRSRQFASTMKGVYYSDCMIVVRQPDGLTNIYNLEFEELASGYIGQKDDVLKIVECTILCKSKDNYVLEYNQLLKPISNGYYDTREKQTGFY